ncbi:MAG TPA: InlB B-repeat-containing protein, partial [Bacilli bacterium]|nr:InlB B-repeat-containing protein [Bacilli bacterium]
MRKILIFLSLSIFLLFLASCVNPQTQITITFNTNGGNVIEDMIVSSTSSSVNLPTPVKEGSTFDGWYTDAEFNSPFTIGALLTNTQLTLFAKWTETINQVTVIFEANGGTAISAVNVAVGGTITAPTAPTKTGFTFDGWFSDSALTTSFVFTTTITSNITLYAKWTPVVTTITVTFDVDGGTAVSSQTINSGQKAILPTAPTKAGYTFGGWYTDSAKTVVFDFDTNLSTNTTIYAKWNINTYTVSFDSIGGSIVPNQTINHGSVATIPTAPTKTGYTFGGWYTTNALTTPYEFTIAVTQNITIYAKWTINTYTVTFDVDGGSSVPAQVVDYNQKATLP